MFSRRWSFLQLRVYICRNILDSKRYQITPRICALISISNADTVTMIARPFFLPTCPFRLWNEWKRRAKMKMEIERSIIIQMPFVFSHASGRFAAADAEEDDAPVECIYRCSTGELYLTNWLTAWLNQKKWKCTNAQQRKRKYNWIFEQLGRFCKTFVAIQLHPMEFM